MANQAYDTYRQLMCTTGAPNWSSATISAALISSGYTPNLTTDQYFSTPATYQVGTSVNLSGITVSNGQVSASATTWSGVTGSQVKYVVIYDNTGTNSTSQLMLIIDTATGSPGLPFTPNGGNFTMTWGSPLFQP